MSTVLRTFRRFGETITCVLVTTIVLALAAAAAPSSPELPRSALPALPALPVIEGSDPDRVTRMASEIVVCAALGLADARLVTIPVDASAGEPFSIVVPIDDVRCDIELSPYSVRAASYELLVQGDDGALVPAKPGPVRTLRGRVDGDAGSIVAGSLLDDGLHLLIDRGRAGRFWLQPVDHIVPGAIDQYAIYDEKSVLPHGGTCGVADAGLAQRDRDALDNPSPLQAGGTPCVAELACDADFEYFLDYGSVGAVEARINAVINTMNVQYERDVAITHAITAILVRTAEPDPYASKNAEALLNEFRDHWLANHGGIVRDVAQLFTGKQVDGTIGIAWLNAVCSSFGFGVVWSDFNGNFARVTDLSAHELGHNWAADHCSCSSHTMNPSNTGANVFHPSFTIPDITAFRDGLSCLSGTCEPPPPPGNDSCATAEPVPCSTQVVLNNSFATPSAGSTDGELPTGSPSCQYQGIPQNTHSTVWYSFVAGDATVDIETCATTAVQDTILALYEGTCGSLTELACGEDDCGGSTYMSRINYTGLTPGNTYLIMVGNPGGWSGSTPGEIILDLACADPDCGTDSVPPTLNEPPDVMVECDESSDPSNTGQATATDICDPDPQVTFVDDVAAGACADESVITRTWRATDASGNFTEADQVITVVDTTAPVVTPPADLPPRNADAGGCSAFITSGEIGTPSANDNCDTSPVISFVRSDGEVLIDAPFDAADSPITITWEAEDACGNVGSAIQTVTVVARNEVLLDLRMHDAVATPLSRCITFEFFLCGGGSVVEQQDIAFTSGSFSGTIEVPCGDYTCVTVQDQLHTLRRMLEAPNFDVLGSQYVADFVAPAKNLVGGNVNDDAFVDIIDFGIFTSQWQLPLGPSSCPPAGPHSDISGNGTVFSEDFAIIAANFGRVREDNCCGLPLGPARRPITRISLDELRRRGLAHLASADLTRDGWLDEEDMLAFLLGARPGK